MTSAELQLELQRAHHFLEALKGVPQDPGWHGEGDVWVHTHMVRDELEKLSDFRALPEDLQNDLRFATAMHDIGKASTTKMAPDDVTGVMKWRAKGHARKGAEMLEHHWWKDGYRLPAETRRLILAIVRYHARPIHGEDRLYNHVAGTSLIVANKLLALIAEADMRGRIPSEKDKGDALLQVDMFREAAKELGCFETPFAWPNDHARFLFFKKEGATLHWHSPDTTTFSVKMMCGLPGSGKSSAVKLLGLPVLSRDEIRRENDFRPCHKRDAGLTSQAFQLALKELLREKKDFVIDGTNLIKSLRGNTIEICANYGARVDILHLDRDRAAVLKNNRERENVIPEIAIEAMAESKETPDLTEAHSVTHL